MRGIWPPANCSAGHWLARAPTYANAKKERRRADKNCFIAEWVRGGKGYAGACSLAQCKIIVVRSRIAIRLNSETPPSATLGRSRTIIPTYVFYWESRMVTGGEPVAALVSQGGLIWPRYLAVEVPTRAAHLGVASYVRSLKRANRKPGS